MPRLEVRDIVVQFPAVRALDGVSMSFEEGEVHGIIGENGAGKSTLMRVMSGLQEPTAGSMSIGGEAKHFRSVADAIGEGISMIHQELNLVDGLTVAENVFLGKEPHRFGILDRVTMKTKTDGYLERVGANFGAEVEVGKLSIAGKQLVEIAKALSYEASVLIMDEPTAVLSETETHNLFALIGDLKAKGVTVIYISHRLAEVEAVCDTISVLRDGKLVRTVRKGEASQSELASLMVGRPLGDMFPPKTSPPEADSILSVSNLSDGVRVLGVDLALRPGEILGLAGLIGSGRTEVAEMLVGVRRPVSGTSTPQPPPPSGKGGGGVLGTSAPEPSPPTPSPFSPSVKKARGLARSPAQAAARGIAYVSEDRKDSGLILSMDVVENITLPNLKAYARPILLKSEEEKAAKGWVQKLNIRAGDLHAPVLFLSGGNQQKVSIAKWLELGPKILILDEPTRGVDVGAKRELYQLIHDLAEGGMACLVISSELPELIGLCHRILVMRQGRIVGEVSEDAMTEEGIMMLAAGVQAA